MRGVSIIGAYETKFGILKDRSLRGLIAEAGNSAIRDAGIEKKAIQALYVGNYAANEFNNQNVMAAYVATVLGLNNIPYIRLEGACASGGLALREGFIAVASGIYDFVLVLGVEKMNTKETPDIMDILAKGMDMDLEANLGVNGPTGFALFAQRHMYEFGTTKEQMAYVAVKNYNNGLKNPDAHLRKKITIEDVLNAPIISTPFGLHDCCLVTDGAAAVVLCPSEIAKRYNDKPIDIIGSGTSGNFFNFFEKSSLVSFEATQKAAKEAYDMAKVSPDDIDLAEVHDCFTTTEIIDIEDLGFFKKGEGGPASKDGKTTIDGEIAINASGGLKSKGHPIGATGVAQTVEISYQLRRLAGERQVKEAEIGLTHVIGGPASICSVHILRRGF
jgi:acetyl-CoA C-acetyltransferase